MTDTSLLLGERLTRCPPNLLLYDSLQSSAREQLRQKIDSGTYVFELVPCCICKGTDFQPLACEDRCGIKTPVVICRGCGLVQTNPRMTDESYANFYREEYRDLLEGERYSRETGYKSEYQRGAEQFEWLRQRGLLPDLDSTRLVLEIGCGSGGILGHFRDKGFRVKGVDLGPAQIEYGRDKRGLDLSLGTIRDLGPLRADIVILSHSLEHLTNPAPDLEHICSLLADDGILFVEVPGIKELWPGYLFDLQLYIQCAHVSHFSLTTLTNLLNKSGFGLVVGDEAIRAAFRKRVGTSEGGDIVSDYDAVLRCLRTTEKMRKVVSIGLAPLVRAVKWVRLQKIRCREAQR